MIFKVGSKVTCIEKHWYMHVSYNKTYTIIKLDPRFENLIWLVNDDYTMSYYNKYDFRLSNEDYCEGVGIV